METVMCAEIKVYCIKNDDSSNFTFFVAASKEEAMKNFITSSFIKYDLPFIELDTDSYVMKPIDEIQSEEDIDIVIRQNASELRNKGVGR